MQIDLYVKQINKIKAMLYVYFQGFSSKVEH